MTKDTQADLVASMLAPIDVATFKREYLHKRPILMKGDASRVQRFMDRERIMRLVQNPKTDMFVTQIAKGAFHSTVVKGDQAETMLDCGFSLQCEELQHVDPELFELANAMRDVLGIYSSMDAAVVVSPPDKGYPVHIDTNPDVFIMQAWGEKHWRWGKEPAYRNPMSWAGLFGKKVWTQEKHHDLKAPDESQFDEATLTPGDILYFPGGVWHGTQAQGESGSLIVSDAVSTWPDFFLGAVRDAICDNTDMRQIPPSTPETIDKVLSQRWDEFKAALEGIDKEALLKSFEAGRFARSKGSSRQNDVW